MIYVYVDLRKSVYKTMCCNKYYMFVCTCVEVVETYGAWF